MFLELGTDLGGGSPCLLAEGPDGATADDAEDPVLSSCELAEEYAEFVWYGGEYCADAGTGWSPVCTSDYGVDAFVVLDTSGHDAGCGVWEM